MIRIRQITEDDSENYLALCKQLDQETKFMMLEPDERTTDAEQQKGRIRSLLATGNSMIFVAEGDKETCWLSGRIRGRIPKKSS